MRIIIPLLLLAFAPVLMAQEADAPTEAEKNAEEFLDSLDEFDEAVLGEHSLNVRCLGHTLGRADFNIELGDYEGQRCYVVTSTIEFKMGVEFEAEGKEYISHDLQVLNSIIRSTADGELESEESIRQKDGAYEIVVTEPDADDEEDRRRTYDVKAEPRLLLATSNMIVYLLMSNEEKSYEFLQFDDDTGENAPLSVACYGMVELFGKQVCRFDTVETDLIEDELGNIDEVESDSGVYVRDQRFVHMEAPDGIVLTTGPEPERTRITREEIEKQEDAASVVAGFFIASLEKDAELLGALLNEEQFMLNALDENPETKGLSDEEKEIYAKMGAANLVENLLADDDEDETDADEEAAETAMIKLLAYRENFRIDEHEKGHMVSFTDEAKRLLGNMKFLVNENDETDKFELTYLSEVPDEDPDEESDEAEPEEPAPEDNGDGSEEEGF